MSERFTAEPTWPSGLNPNALCLPPDMVAEYVTDERLDLLAADLVWQHPAIFESWDERGISFAWRLSDPDDLVIYDHKARRVSLSAIAAGDKGMTVRQVRSALYLAMLAAVNFGRQEKKPRRIRVVQPNPLELVTGQRSLFDA